MTKTADLRDASGGLVRRRTDGRGLLATTWRYFTGQAVSDAVATLHYERGRADERAAASAAEFPQLWDAVRSEWAVARAELDGPFAAVWAAVDASMEAGEPSQAVASRALSAVWEAAVTVTGADLIRRERMRQITGEGWTPAHDAQHRPRQAGDPGPLAYAAVAYASRATALWPWPDTTPPLLSFPDDAERVRELVKAGALLAAEIDRVHAASSPGSGTVPASEGEQP